MYNIVENISNIKKCSIIELCKKDISKYSLNRGISFFTFLVSIPAQHSAVYAQQSAPADSKPNQGSYGTVDGGQKDESLPDIVVTATKRSESLAKVPLAVSAVSMDQLRNAGVQSLKDITGVVPGVQIGTVALANTVTVTIRGISNNDFSAGGNPAVATYVDGIYIGKTWGLGNALYDLTRIEVLRGPQGTLYGRNATGGNINIVTADPVQEFAASADISYGNYRDVEAHAMVNAALSDTLAIRGAMVFHRNDGYYDTKGTTAQNYGKADEYGGRLSLLWRPTDNFKWRLSADRFEASGTPAIDILTGLNGEPADGLPIFHRPMPGFPEPKNSVKNTMVRSRMDLDISGGMTLSYIAGYQKVSTTQIFADSANNTNGLRA